MIPCDEQFARLIVHYHTSKHSIESFRQFLSNLKQRYFACESPMRAVIQLHCASLLAIATSDSGQALGFVAHCLPICQLLGRPSGEETNCIKLLFYNRILAKVPNLIKMHVYGAKCAFLIVIQVLKLTLRKISPIIQTNFTSSRVPTPASGAKIYAAKKRSSLTWECRNNLLIIVTGRQRQVP